MHNNAGERLDNFSERDKGHPQRRPDSRGRCALHRQFRPNSRLGRNPHREGHAEHRTGDQQGGRRRRSVEGGQGPRLRRNLDACVVPREQGQREACGDGHRFSQRARVQRAEVHPRWQGDHEAGVRCGDGSCRQATGGLRGRHDQTRAETDLRRRPGPEIRRRLVRGSQRRSTWAGEPRYHTP